MRRALCLFAAPKCETAVAASRREFITVLRNELPKALRLMQTGNIAPVDLAQAAIGPGMAIYTRYAKVPTAILQGEYLLEQQPQSLISTVVVDQLAI